MSDECLMTLEFGFSFYIVYQAVMRKFTLAEDLDWNDFLFVNSHSVITVFNYPSGKQDYEMVLEPALA